MISLVNLFIPFRQAQRLQRLNIYNQRRVIYKFCSENKKTEEIEKQPSLVIDILHTVKDSAIGSATKLTEKVKGSAVKFKTDANQNKETSIGKTCLNMAKLAWRKTFPSHDDEVKARMETVKAKLAERKKEEEKFAQMTEEELAAIQEKIPEWKRNAVQATDQGTSEEASLKSKIAQKIQSRLKQSEQGQHIVNSEAFKEYVTFKAEMKQFKADLSDKIQNHPSNFVQVSLYAAKTVTNESDVARAIRQMRMIDPDFDLYELEKEAKVIFEQIYNLYLLGDLESLQKVCGEAALGYFKVLLKKQEAEKSEPKHKQLWNVDEIRFTRASIPDSVKLPVFVFTIKTQEIFCYVSKTDRSKIVDGDDERIMSMDYQFALTPHSNPSSDEFGHIWEMIELQPQQVVKMLV
ncbi:unnamed protein product [Paramecium primaurelia]|uniref:Tim44-like domain-containing protein n=2 Tax=Paramecium TaxID=5884 RepID=A0A8S1UJ31_9CILI|nr:unnamed protein product [Paramecium primaurelia]CAD8165068.1 unnamed protein product [Paramecium pentaurelia]